MRKTILFLLILLTLCTACMTGCSKKWDTAEYTDVKTAAESGTPLDWESIHARNKDICAWIYIPGTKINDPIYCNEDDSKYADYRLYIQSGFNQADFSDPATVVYGPLTYDGSLFGALQDIFLEDGSLDEKSPIAVCTENGTRYYKAFAASLFNSKHLLHTYGRLENIQGREAFLEDLKNYHVLSHQWDDSVQITEDEPLLILSCHTTQNKYLRFIVVAKPVDQTADTLPAEYVQTHKKIIRAENPG